MNDIIVARVDKARLLLMQARDAVDAKQVVDLAHAAEVYAKRQGLAQDAIDYARSVRVDAMTLMGEFLKAGPKNKGTAGKGRPKKGGTKREPPNGTPPTRKALLGKDGKKVASDAQALAKLKKDAPDLYKQVRDGKLTIAKARQEVKRQAKREEMEAKAKAAKAKVRKKKGG